MNGWDNSDRWFDHAPVYKFISKNGNTTSRDILDNLCPDFNNLSIERMHIERSRLVRRLLRMTKQGYLKRRPLPGGNGRTVYQYTLKENRWE